MNQSYPKDDLLLSYTKFVPAEKSTFKLSNSSIFFQEPYFLDKNRFVNLYWVEFDKKLTRFCLLNLLNKKPLKKIAKSFEKSLGKSCLAAINTCNFYSVDIGKEPPVCVYNLFVKDGKVLQFPSSGRTAVIERGGSLEIKYLKPEGSLRIGSQILWWAGSKCRSHGNIARVSGVFNVMFTSWGKDSNRRAKQAIKETTVVSCSKGRVLVGVGLDKKSRPIVVKKSRHKLSLLDYCCIIEVSMTTSRSIKIGDCVDKVTVGDYQVKDGDNAASLSFSLPKSPGDIEKVVTREIRAVNGKVRPLGRRYFKSWSLILTTKGKVIFFLVDSYPYKAGQEGINLFELHDLLRNKFDFESCAVCDGGQTGKLCLGVPRKDFLVFGNRHYINYAWSVPRRDGVNGRPIPSALVAYEG